MKVKQEPIRSTKFHKVCKVGYTISKRFHEVCVVVFCLRNQFRVWTLDADEQYEYLQDIIFSEAFTATWSKYYCTYKKQLKQFSMLQYNQISGKTVTLLFFKKIILLIKYICPKYNFLHLACRFVQKKGLRPYSY